MNNMLKSVGLALLFTTLGISGAASQSLPLPKYYGVFALSHGQLTELKRNPQSDTLYTALAGADVIQTLSGITFPDGNLRFIIFSPQVASLGTADMSVDVLARIANAPPPAFHVTTWGRTFHVAPVPNQPQMVQLIADTPTTGGHLALIFNGVYDFEVQAPPDMQHGCVQRLLSIMGASYQPC
jgi:hypothetical protein